MFPLPGYQDSGRIFVDTEINDQLELLRQTQIHRPGRSEAISTNEKRRQMTSTNKNRRPGPASYGSILAL